MSTYLLLLNLLSFASASLLKEHFLRRVDPIEPNRYAHTVHLRTGLGRVTHFSYDSVTHESLIAPHYGDHFQVTACTQHDVTIRVKSGGVAEAARWSGGWKFTTHDDHFNCPNALDGVKNNSPTYRHVDSVASVKQADGSVVCTLQTSPASFSEMFNTLSMKMHSSHILHASPSQIEAHENPTEIEEHPPEDGGQVEKDGDRRLLLSKRFLHHHHHHHPHLKKFRKKTKKSIKKHVVQPVKKVLKLIKGDVQKTWEKEFSMDWNYNKNTGRALKSYDIGSGKTSCSSCFFHFKSGYIVEIDVKKYHLQKLHAEVYGDAKMELAMTNPGLAAVDIQKTDNVMNKQLFSWSFAIGPVPLTVSLDLEVDLGLHLTIKETGKLPHVHVKVCSLVIVISFFCQFSNADFIDVIFFASFLIFFYFPPPLFL